MATSSQSDNISLVDTSEFSILTSNIFNDQTWLTVVDGADPEETLNLDSWMIGAYDEMPPERITALSRSLQKRNSPSARLSTAQTSVVADINSVEPTPVKKTTARVEECTPKNTKPRSKSRLPTATRAIRNVFSLHKTSATEPAKPQTNGVNKYSRPSDNNINTPTTSRGSSVQSNARMSVSTANGKPPTMARADMKTFAPSQVSPKTNALSTSVTPTVLPTFSDLENRVRQQELELLEQLRFERLTLESRPASSASNGVSSSLTGSGYMATSKSVDFRVQTPQPSSTQTHTPSRIPMFKRESSKTSIPIPARLKSPSPHLPGTKLTTRSQPSTARPNDQWGDNCF